MYVKNKPITVRIRIVEVTEPPPQPANKKRRSKKNKNKEKVDEISQYYNRDDIFGDPFVHLLNEKNEPVAAKKELHEGLYDRNAIFGDPFAHLMKDQQNAPAQIDHQPIVQEPIVPPPVNVPLVEQMYRYKIRAAIQAGNTELVQQVR